MEHFDVPVPEGTVSRWEANDGLELAGFLANGLGYVIVPGVATYRFDVFGPVTGSSDGGTLEAIEDTWVRSVLPLVVQARGTQVLHASAVDGPSGVLALCGLSMGGKSTLAAAMMARGHRVVADDALAFNGESGEVTALTLPFRLRLRPASAEALELPGIAARGPGGDRLPLVSIVLLDPHDNEAAPMMEAVGAAEAVGALMPHAYCFALDEGKAELVAAYAGLAGAVPVRRLTYRQRLDRLDQVADLLIGYV